MMLRIVLILTLIAAAGSVLAAPPRFARPATLPEKTVNSQPAPATTAKPEADGGVAVAANPSSQDMQNPGDSREQAATANATAMVDTAPEQKASPIHSQTEPQQQREPLLIWRRQSSKPVVKTYKGEEQLVPTESHHMREVEQLGIAPLHQHRAGYRSFWKVNSTKVMCQMTQQIPHYGQVEFRQGVGQPLEFALYVANPPAGVGRARIRTEPPQWHHFTQARDLGVIQLEPGERAVAAPADWSRRLFLDLSEGLQPVIRYWDAADATDDMEVILSAMNFQNSLDLFNRCVGQLLRYDFKSARRTIVYFHPDSSKLRAKARQQLEDVLELIKDDAGIKQVDLELYTVDKGLVRYNFRLATRRARAVRDYLIKQGIDEDKLLIKIHTMKLNKLRKIGYKTTDVHVVLRRKVAK